MRKIWLISVESGCIQFLQDLACKIEAMDNTEGSRAITSVFRARKNLELCLTNRQMSIVLGSILGDAYIYPKGKICFEHSHAQREFLFWKYSELRNLAYSFVAQVRRVDKRTNKPTVSWRFFLRQYFKPLRIAFYQHNRKVIPSDLRSWMSPLLLAVWYMDDGNLDKSKYPILMTENYSKRDLNLLARMLKDSFQLDSKITNKNRIRIKSKSRERFFSLIEPHITKDLRYKLP
jgi:hypothetical protein